MSTESKVLIVGADPRDRQLILSQLESAEYTFVEAEDSQSALDHVAESELVVCELRLQGNTNGIDLMQTWHQQRPATPFVLVAEPDESSSAIEAMRHGAADFVTKPINLDELMVRIAKWLDASRKEERLEQLESKLERETVHHGNGNGTGIDFPAGTSLEDLERVAVERALEQHHGNRTHAAKTLGISVRTLQRKLKAWRAPVLTLKQRPRSKEFAMQFAH
jgi:DNA-binding NtrC family response regulator